MVVWRRAELERIGGFDTELEGLEDWDLALRATSERPARPIDILAARYRELDNQRVSLRSMYGVNLLKIRRKSPPRAGGDGPLRVLYLLPRDPQPCETDLKTELQTVRRWGAEVAMWREEPPATPPGSDVPALDGTLADAIRRFGPDVIHIHGIDLARRHGDVVGALGLPATVRAHSGEAFAPGMEKLRRRRWVHRIYATPHQTTLVARSPLLRPAMVPFDTTLFPPREDKDRHLVVCVSAGWEREDIDFVSALAARQPSYHFVLASLGPAREQDGRPRAPSAPAGAAVEIQGEVSHQSMAELMGRAAVCLHPGHARGENAGPSTQALASMVEAMATGAIPLVPQQAELTSLVAEAGLAYRDLEEAGHVLASMSQWTDEQWRRRWRCSVERAYTHHADIIATRVLYEDWAAMRKSASKTDAPRRWA